MLELGPDKRLLEVGAGSGWPGLYLAKETGCDVALIDLPIEGLRVAKKRAASDLLPGAYCVAVADGSMLPFRRGWFDAIFHSDVLCCLVEKQAVLRACRDVVHPDGQMVFAVILIAPDLTAVNYQEALAGGPTFIESPDTYLNLLRRADWAVTDHVDLTAQYLASTRRVFEEELARTNDLDQLLGANETCQLLDRRRATINALEQGLLRRELFHAVPLPVGE
jgi:2-polyprenyl-3-methyl-5-hydroxy-6-metoxy-1,4-benzoquinol methylase